MIELSPEIKELLEDIFLNHGETMLKCILENCVNIFDGNKISISEECIKAIIEMIEDEKKIALEEAQKEELKKLMQYQEQELKEWFAMLMGIDRNKIGNMSVFDILRNGKKSIFDREESSVVFKILCQHRVIPKIIS